MKLKSGYLISYLGIAFAACILPNDVTKLADLVLDFKWSTLSDPGWSPKEVCESSSMLRHPTHLQFCEHAIRASKHSQ